MICLAFENRRRKQKLILFVIFILHSTNVNKVNEINVCGYDNRKLALIDH